MNKYKELANVTGDFSLKLHDSPSFKYLIDYHNQHLTYAPSNPQDDFFLKFFLFFLYKKNISVLLSLTYLLNSPVEKDDEMFSEAPFALNIRSLLSDQLLVRYIIYDALSVNGNLEIEKLKEKLFSYLTKEHCKYLVHAHFSIYQLDKQCRNENIFDVKEKTDSKLALFEKYIAINSKRIPVTANIRKFPSKTSDMLEEVRVKFGEQDENYILYKDLYDLWSDNSKYEHTSFISLVIDKNRRLYFERIKSGISQCIGGIGFYEEIVAQFTHDKSFHRTVHEFVTKIKGVR